MPTIYNTRTVPSTYWGGRNDVTFLMTEALDFLMTEALDFLITNESPLIETTWNTRAII